MISAMTSSLRLELFLQFGHFLLHLAGGPDGASLAKAAAPFSKKVFCHW